MGSEEIDASASIRFGKKISFGKLRCASPPVYFHRADWKSEEFSLIG
jgi:hypothetical protein